jgi:hypothetical protein
MNSLTKEQKQYMELERKQIVTALKGLQDNKIDSLPIDEIIKFVNGRTILVEKRER